MTGERLSPYQIVEEDESHVTYEYRTAYTWALYGILAAFVAGATIPNDALATTAGVFMTFYFVTKLGLGTEATGRIRRAMKTRSVQLSGSRMSFSNPLRIRVPK